MVFNISIYNNCKVRDPLSAALLNVCLARRKRKNIKESEKKVKVLA